MKKDILKLQIKIVKSHSRDSIKDIPSKHGYSYKDLQRICVYFHYYGDEDKPFYVGQGTIQRAFNFLNRNNLWKEKVRDITKVKIKIIHIDISIEDSINYEKKYINQYGRISDNSGCLVNENNGDTAIGQKGKSNYFYNKHLYGNLNGNYNNKYENNPLSIPIIQIDILGNIVKEWASAKEASEKGCYSAACISKCCLNKRSIHKGYQWIYKSDYVKDKDYSFIPSKTNKSIIIKLDIYGKYIKTYYSNKELIRDGYIPRNVQQVATGYKKTHRGYKFINFFKLSKEEKEKYINNIDITMYN